MKTNIYVTDIKNNKFLEKSEKEPLTVDRFGGWGLVSVFPDVKYQTIQGFGGAFTESSAYVFSKMSKEKQDEILKAYFDKDNGNGYNFCRLHIASCDFSVDEYTYIDEGDDKLETFSIERDKKYIIPMVKAAQKYGKIKLFASPWSPPAFMKDTKSRYVGGKLLPEYYEAWTNYVEKFILAYREEGIEVSAVTIQNEEEADMMWESCLYTPQDECNLIKSGFGEKMRKLGVKIYIWDHNKSRCYDRASTVYEDKEAAQYVAGVALHWYDGDHFEQLNMLREKYPDKEIIFSEGCCASYTVGVMKEEGLEFAQKYAHELIGDLKNGLNAFCDWNLILDMQNGPFHKREGRMLCDAPIIADTDKDEITKELSYYYLAHFTRFIKQGAVRIASSGCTDKVESVAFLNPDGSYVVILHNKTNEEQKANVLLGGRKTEYMCPANSITTMVM